MLNKVALKLEIRLYADKGYAGLPNHLAKVKKLKSAIQKKATRNHSLSPTAKRFNKLIAKTRYKIERVFESIKSWLKSSKVRYIGLDKTHTQYFLEAIAPNLYRIPNIIITPSISAQKLSENLVQKAFKISQDKNAETPFQHEAIANGYSYEWSKGGKEDDITVVVYIHR